jgi:hypothetical protein
MYITWLDPGASSFQSGTGEPRRLPVSGFSLRSRCAPISRRAVRPDQQKLEYRRDDIW